MIPLPNLPFFRIPTSDFRILTFLFLFLPFLLPAQSTMWLTIDAGNTDRMPAPFFVPLPAQFSQFDYFRLVDGGNNQVLYAQRWNGDSAVFVLNRALAAGQQRLYVLQGVTERPEGGVQMERDEAGVKVSVDGRHLFTYHSRVVEPPSGSPAYYRASGYVHPLKSPGGRILTDGFPVGHMHQHGFFMTWVNTTFRGDFTDFWNQQNKTGTVEHVEVLETADGPVFGRLRVRLRHVSLKHGPVLEEERTFTVYRSVSPFILDIRSEQRCATADTLYLNEYNYGGLAFRGNAQWNAADSARYVSEIQVLTSEGITRAESNHTRPVWVAGYGAIDGEAAGVAILDHPRNFRFPQPVRVHPEMPYFCFPPMVLGAFTIDPGDTYISEYRLLSYDGEPVKEELDKYWQDYTGKKP